MARTPVDALRSLKRYVALAVGPDWEVRLSSEKGVFNRPYARVIQVPAIEFTPVRLPVVRVTAAYQVVLFPKPGASADESQLGAMEVVDLIWAAFSGPGIGMGRTERIPLYDYTGVPLTAGVDESHRDPDDFMKLVAPPNVVPYNDPADELLFSVAVNLRMTWLRSAARPITAPDVAAVNPVVVPVP